MPHPTTSGVPRQCCRLCRRTRSCGGSGTASRLVCSVLMASCRQARLACLPRRHPRACLLCRLCQARLRQCRRPRPQPSLPLQLRSRRRPPTSEPSRSNSLRCCEGGSHLRGDGGRASTLHGLCRRQLAARMRVLSGWQRLRSSAPKLIASRASRRSSRSVVSRRAWLGSRHRSSSWRRGSRSASGGNGCSNRRLLRELLCTRLPRGPSACLPLEPQVGAAAATLSSWTAAYRRCPRRPR